MHRYNHRNGSLWWLSLYGTQVGKVGAFSKLADWVSFLNDNSLPLYLSQLLLKLQQHYHYLVEQIKDLESQLKRKLDEDEVGQRLLSIPCVGTLTASTISTEIGDGKQYACTRDFAAATRLIPRQYSTGGRTTLLGISKRGNKKIRTLLVQCARVSYKNWNTCLANWPIGSGIYCVRKATLSSLVLWQTSWPE